MPQDPLREAYWRFEENSPLLEPRLTGSERRRMTEKMGRACVRWPSGHEAPGTGGNERCMTPEKANAQAKQLHKMRHL